MVLAVWDNLSGTDQVTAFGDGDILRQRSGHHIKSEGHVARILAGKFAADDIVANRSYHDHFLDDRTGGVVQGEFDSEAIIDANILPAGHLESDAVA